MAGKGEKKNRKVFFSPNVIEGKRKTKRKDFFLMGSLLEKQIRKDY
jgi:hypothetical protein